LFCLAFIIKHYKFYIIKILVTNQWVKKLTLLTVFCRNEQGDFREIFELFKI